MSSKISGRYERVLGEIESDDDPVRQDRDTLSVTDLDIVESGIDFVEHAEPTNPIARELARSREPRFAEANASAISSSTEDATRIGARKTSSSSITRGDSSVEDAGRVNVCARTTVATPRGVSAVSGASKKHGFASWMLRVAAAMRSFFASSVRGHDEASPVASMVVEEVIQLRDGRAIFVGPLDGAHRFTEPSFWWVVLGGKGWVLVGIDGEVIASRGRRGTRAIATRDAIDPDVLRKHTGPIELVEISD